MRSQRDREISFWRKNSATSLTFFEKKGGSPPSGGFKKSGEGESKLEVVLRRESAKAKRSLAPWDWIPVYHLALSTWSNSIRSMYTSGMNYRVQNRNELLPIIFERLKMLVRQPRREKSIMWCSFLYVFGGFLIYIRDTCIPRSATGTLMMVLSFLYKAKAVGDRWWLLGFSMNILIPVGLQWPNPPAHLTHVLTSISCTGRPARWILTTTTTCNVKYGEILLWMDVPWVELSSMGCFPLPVKYFLPGWIRSLDFSRSRKCQVETRAEECPSEPALSGGGYQGRGSVSNDHGNNTRSIYEAKLDCVYRMNAYMGTMRIKPGDQRDAGDCRGGQGPEGRWSTVSPEGFFEARRHHRIKSV